MNNKELLFGRLKHVEAKNGFIDAMFCKNDEPNSSIRLEFQDKEKDLGNLEFKNKYSIYKNYELHNIKLAVEAVQVRTTTTGKPVMKVLKIQTRKNYYIEKETDPLQISEQLQNTVVLSEQAKIQAAQLSLQLEKMEDDCLEWLCLIAGHSQKKSLFLMENVEGKKLYKLSINTHKDSVIRFEAKTRAELYEKVVAYGNERRRGYTQNE